MADVVSRAEEILGAHPKLFIFIVIVFCTAMGISLRAFAHKEDLEAHIRSEDASRNNLINSLEALKVSVETKFLLQDINRLDSEIYEIENLESAGQILQRDRTRLVQLRSQLNEARRQLNMLENENR